MEIIERSPKCLQKTQHRGKEALRNGAPRFGGVAKRRARPESDGNTSRVEIAWLVFPSDPAAPAGLLRRPAAEPIGVFFALRRTRNNVRDEIFVSFVSFVSTLRVLRVLRGGESRFDIATLRQNDSLNPSCPDRGTYALPRFWRGCPKLALLMIVTNDPKLSWLNRLNTSPVSARRALPGSLICS